MFSRTHLAMFLGGFLMVLTGAAVTPSNGLVRLWDGVDKSGVDPLGYLVTIDILHHKVHTGGVFYFHVEDDVDLGASNRLVIQIKTGGTLPHFTGEVIADKPGTIYFYEDPVIDVEGAAVTVHNRRRPSDRVSLTTVFMDTTTTNDGTLLFSQRVGAATGPPTRPVGGAVDQRLEWVLKPNTSYILVFEADGNDTYVDIAAEWYDETL